VTVGARDRALDEDEVLVGQHLHDLKVLEGATHLAHVAGHGLILPRTAGRLAHADGTDTAMEHRAVGGGAARNAEAANDALETLTLGDADDIDQLAFFESLDGDHITGLLGGFV